MIYASVLFICWCTSVVAGPQEELFLQAAQHYRAGNPGGALELYQQIPDKGPVVWHNMGNCAWQLDDALCAKLYWRRAQKGAPRKLYQTTAALLATHIYQRSPSMVERCILWCKSVAVSAPLGALQLLVLLILYGIWFFWYKRMRFCMITLLCCLMMSGFFLYTTYDIRTTQQAIVMAPTGIFAGPNAQYAQLSAADVMDEVIVLAQAADWYKISSTANGVGWISKTCVALI